MSIRFSLLLLFFAPLVLLAADDEPWPGDVPDRAEGDGPYERLILRGPIVIDGTGAPPWGPVDIVIENNRIVEIHNVAMGGIFVEDERRPQAEEDTREFDLTGMYVLPGFIDMHGHVGGRGQGVSADYVFRLWMAHGVTTVRDPGSGAGVDWMVEHRRKSAENTITAPRLRPYVTFGSGHEGPITTVDQARQ